jgi:hypothetical protein
MIQETSFRSICDKISSEVPFTFSRWGDGEWRAVLGKVQGQNCDGHPFSQSLCDEMRNVLRGRPNYMLGMQSFALRGWGPKILYWLGTEGLNFTWHDADVFHKAAIYKRMDLLLAAVNQHPVILVGPDHLKRAKKHIPYYKFVDVPPRNAFYARHRIIKDVLAALDCAAAPKHAVISVSAGMPAEIIIDVLHRRLGRRHTLVDFGSVWDPLAGVRSRRYMRR